MVEFSRAYNFVRSRQLEGTIQEGQSVGTWGITSNRISFGWGRVPETSWPYFSGTRTLQDPEPPNMDQIAKLNRIKSYQRIRSVGDLVAVLQHNLVMMERSARWRVPLTGYIEAKAAFEITQQFVDSLDGRISEPPQDAPIVGTHAVPFLEADLKSRMLLFINSWGERWGRYGSGFMPFEFFDKWMVESWAIDESTANLSQGTNVLNLQWEAPSILSDKIYVCEIYDSANDDRIGWSIAVPRDGHLDVEELFVKPAYRGNGYGNAIAEMISSHRQVLGLPLRAWIPFVDCEESNRGPLSCLMQRLGLSLRRSGATWAAYRAVASKRKQIIFEPVRIPDRPALVRGSEVAPVPAVVGTVEGTAVAETDQWARLARKARIQRLAEDLD